MRHSAKPRACLIRPNPLPSKACTPNNTGSMDYKLAIDFGTTNSVVARWDAETETPEIISVAGISQPTDTDGRPPLVPSLLYVHDAAANHVTIGQAVRDNKLDTQRDNRLFRNFKRGIVAMPAPDPREIDGHAYADRDAGQSFVRTLL